MTTQYFFDRAGGPKPDLRAADADRERIAERLRQAHAEGRLDLAEFQQRLERCYEAKTVRELDQLVTDLPRPDELDDRSQSGRFWLRPLRLAPLAPILIALLFISAVTGHGVFWLWIPLLFIMLRMSWWHRRRSWAGPRRGPDGWI